MLDLQHLEITMMTEMRLQAGVAISLVPAPAQSSWTPKGLRLQSCNGPIFLEPNND